MLDNEQAFGGWVEQDAAAALAACLDTLARVNPDTLSDAELSEALVEVHRLEARLAAIRRELHRRLRARIRAEEQPEGHADEPDGGGA